MLISDLQISHYWSVVRRTLELMNEPAEYADNFRHEVEGWPIERQELFYHSEPLYVAQDITGREVPEEMMYEYDDFLNESIDSSTLPSRVADLETHLSEEMTFQNPFRMHFGTKIPDLALRRQLSQLTEFSENLHRDLQSLEDTNRENGMELRELLFTLRKNLVVSGSTLLPILGVVILEIFSAQISSESRNIILSVAVSLLGGLGIFYVLEYRRLRWMGERIRTK